AERDPGVTADRGDLLLLPAALGARLREAAIEDDGRADTALSGRPHVLEHARVVHADRERVDAARELGDGGVALPAEQRLVPRVDRVNRAAEPDRVERLDQRTADRRTLGRAEDGHGAGAKQGVK